MKKKIILMIGIIVLVILSTNICFAGSVPEDLLHEDNAQLYFGKILDYHENTQTAVVSPVKNIKGDIVIGSKQTLEDCIPIGTKDNIPRKGEVCLIAYYDDVNPIYIFKTTSDNPATLKIKNIDGMDMFERLQEYINDGSFIKAENARIGKVHNAAQAFEDNEELQKPIIRFLYKKTVFLISLTFILLYIILSFLKRRWCKVVKIIIGSILTLYGLAAAGGAKHYFLYKLYEKWGNTFVEPIREFIPKAIAEYSKDIFILGNITIALIIIGAALIEKANQQHIGTYVVLSFVSINLISVILGFFTINAMFDIGTYISNFAYFVSLCLFVILIIRNIKRLQE